MPATALKVASYVASHIDDDDLVQIAPDDMVLGHDADGLPRTEPSSDPAKVKAAPKSEPVKNQDDELARAQQERLAAIRERDAERAARSAIEADAATKLDAERRARVAAEDTALTRTDQAMRAHWRSVNGDLSQIAGAIAATQSEATSAERDYVTASEAGDHIRAAAAQRAMAKAEAALMQLESGKTAAEAEVERTRRAFEAVAAQPEHRPEPTQPKKEEPSAKPQITPDQWIAQWPRKTTGSWLTEHKDYVTDTAKHADLIAFSNEFAADYGPHMLHTPQFIAALNEKFDPQATAESEESTMAADDEPEIAEEKQPIRKSTPSAPVRGNATTPSRPANGNAIKLSADQYAIAPDLYPKYEDLSPEAQQKFPSWSANAARWQYHNDLKRAQKDNKFKI